MVLWSKINICKFSEEKNLWALLLFETENFAAVALHVRAAKFADFFVKTPYSEYLFGWAVY